MGVLGEPNIPAAHLLTIGHRELASVNGKRRELNIISWLSKGKAGEPSYMICGV
jgi:hypothetical protein